MGLTTLAIAYGYVAGPLAVLVSIGCLWALARWRGARTSQRVRRELGQPVTLTRSGPATLRGVIHSEHPCARPDDGEPAAAVTVATSGRRWWYTDADKPLSFSYAGERVEVEVDGRRVALEGDIEVECGVREWFTGRTLRKLPRAVLERIPFEHIDAAAFAAVGDQLGVVRSVHDGDEVVVHGELVERDDEAGRNATAYRSKATRWVMRDPIVAVAGAPRFAATWWRVALTPAAMVLGLGLAGYWGVAYARLIVERDVCAQRCAQHGLCDVVVDELVPLVTRCGPTSAEHCAQSAACKQRGDCSLHPDGRCEALRDEDCAQSADCADIGACAARSGFCVAASPEHCAQSEACRISGGCSLFHSKCYPLSDADCAESLGCSEGGACEYHDSGCRVPLSQMCRQSDGCLQQGTCGVADGQCVVRSDPDCAQSAGCHEHGRCATWASEDAIHCAATRDEMCVASTDCAEHGLCEARARRCVATPESCLASRDCHENGTCVADGGVCVDEDGHDICDGTDECAERGVCTLRGGVCAVGSDADCRQSELCKSAGHCTLELGRCAVVSDADCELSDACRTMGHCQADKGWCQSAE